MTTRPTITLTPAQREALEARFALRVSARLNEGAAALPHDISERLRVARQQAVRLAAQPALAPAKLPEVATAPLLSPALVSAGAGAPTPNLIRLPGLHGLGRDHGRQFSDSPLPWGWKLATAVPVLALVAGLWGIQAWFRAEKVQAATDVDVQLLADDLPPSAYADPGFAEFLRTDHDDTTLRPMETQASEPDGDLKTEEAAPATATP